MSHLPGVCDWYGCLDRTDPGWGLNICRKHAAYVWAVVNEQIAESALSEDEVRARGREEQEALRTGRLASRAAQERPGEVYYLRVGDRIKIGWTGNVYRRRTEYPPNAELLATEVGDRRLERRRHQDFRAYLAGGREWFHPAPELLHHIAELQPLPPRHESRHEERKRRTAELAARLAAAQAGSAS